MRTALAVRPTPRKVLLLGGEESKSHEVDDDAAVKSPSEPAKSPGRWPIDAAFLPNCR
jgi:hypothetical protein